MFLVISGGGRFGDRRIALENRSAEWSRSAVMPPCCEVCRVTSRDAEYDTFTLVHFRAIAPALEHAGHPENALWFCKDHVRHTEGKTHMSAILAMVHVRASVRRDAPNTWPLRSMP
jgi:hypothetical protein